MLVGKSEHGADIAGEILVGGIYMLKLQFNQDHAGTFNMIYLHAYLKCKVACYNM